MPRLFLTFTAFCLAVLWLPATLCCKAEAASGEAFSLCSESCEDKGGGDVRDNCALVEDGNYSSNPLLVKVTLPMLVVIRTAFNGAPAAPRGLMPDATIRLTESDWNLDWVPSWNFERRAAAPAHAPDSLNT